MIGAHRHLFTKNIAKAGLSKNLGQDLASDKADPVSENHWETNVRNVLGVYQALLVLLVLGALTATPLMAQNSTRKSRVQPNEVSAKVGSAVNWSKSLRTALAESKKSGKPVFWYISTVPGTFMDRKPVIDRYMLGGPFSWPPIIDLLNEHFVPLKVAPGRAEAALGIRPYQFVEPGFLVLGSDKKVFGKVDRITTFQYQWFASLLNEMLVKSGRKGLAESGAVWIPKLPKYFAQLQNEPAQWVDPVGEGFARNAENLLASGMIAFRRGDHLKAKQRWEEAARVEPDSPLAWKASLEAQGIGPFYRGFETYQAIPERAFKAGMDSPGSAAPAETYEKNELYKRGVDFLLGMQRADGAFVDSDYDFGGTDSLPNVYVAVTSLAGMALLKAQDQLPQKSRQIEQAILNVEKFVNDPANINQADRDEILWAYAYRLRFLSRLAKQPELKQQVPRIDEKLQLAITALENIQLKTGNWYHEYNNPFVTATALNALYEAKQVGGKLDESKIALGTKSLLLDREPNGSYPYYSVRRKAERSEAERSRMLKAAAGRMPICELALVRWSQLKPTWLEAAVKNSLEQHRHLASGYKYDNHTSNMAYGGFFFWYDMRSRSEAIRELPNEQREQHSSKQQEIILKLPEIDGCFVDSHELGRCYGTAMAILSMN